jgi:hypothetical protein
MQIYQNYKMAAKLIYCHKIDLFSQPGKAGASDHLVLN